MVGGDGETEAGLPAPVAELVGEELLGDVLVVLVDEVQHVQRWTEEEKEGADSKMTSGMRKIRRSVRFNMLETSPTVH